MNEDEIMHDELTEADLEFINRWENMGKEDEIPDADASLLDEMQDGENDYYASSEAPDSENTVDAEATTDAEVSAGEGEEVSEQDADPSEGEGEAESDNLSDQKTESEEPETEEAPEAEVEEVEEQVEQTRTETVPDDGGEANTDDEDMGEPESADFEQPEEVQPEQSEESSDAPESDQKQSWENMPDKPDLCADHCEDNPTDEEAPECPYCSERIEREREQWGVVATDMHGNDLSPGDKVLVRVPNAFMQVDAILSVNVPNEEFDRVVQSTAGEAFPNLLWLSGPQISQFTGFHLMNDGPVWTFAQGSQIEYVEKIGQPEKRDEQDVEQEIQDFLDQIPETPEPEEKESENEAEADVEAEPETETEEAEDKDEEDKDDQEQLDEILADEEHHEEDHRDSEALTKTQLDRFENIATRVHKKAEITFGQTLESAKHGETHITENKHHAAKTLKIVSRGVEYNILISASRKKSD